MRNGRNPRKATCLLAVSFELFLVFFVHSPIPKEVSEPNKQVAMPRGRVWAWQAKKKAQFPLQGISGRCHVCGREGRQYHSATGDKNF